MSKCPLPDITVAVCTHNRAAMLRDALMSLTAQHTASRFSYEVLVIDNASTDHTSEVVAELVAGSNVPVRYSREPRKGLAYARNRAVAEARGEWHAMFDDDQIADPRWLAELLALAKERNVRSVGGAVHLRLPDGCQRQLSEVCRRLLGASVGWNVARPYTRKEGPGSGNQMLHRSVFEQVGLYDDSYNQRGMDTDHYRRIRAAGIESWYTPDAVVWHVTPPSRLEEKYLRSVSLHNGWCFARRDFQEWGRLALAGVAVARLGQALCMHFPRWLWAKSAGQSEQRVAARCLFWRMRGYVRCALLLIASPFSKT